MAKKFSYRLEPLLKLRSHKVNQAKDSLSAVLRLRYNKDEAIDAKQVYRKNLSQSNYKSRKAIDFQAIASHKQLVENEINNLDKERRQLLEIEQLRRNKLQFAMKEEKMLIKLKEKKLEQYNYETVKEENNFIDEIAIQNFSKNQSDKAE